MYPDIKIACVANLWSRQMHFKKTGDIEAGHSHVFDHLTLLAKGSVKVTVEGKSTVFSAPHMVYIKKNKIHEIEALEDNTLAYCIHALRDGEGAGDILDPDMVPDNIDANLIANQLININ